MAEYEYLSQNVFPNLRMGLLHGRMAAKDKEKVMQQFHDKELDILVSTPVIEVGIDVPNATVMMVESADRFGSVAAAPVPRPGRPGPGPELLHLIIPEPFGSRSGTACR